MAQVDAFLIKLEASRGEFDLLVTNLSLVSGDLDNKVIKLSPVPFEVDYK